MAAPPGIDDSPAILSFLDKIGTATRFASIAPSTFVPGMPVEHGALVPDMDAMRHPGAG